MSEYTLTRKIVPVGSSLGVTIPKEILKALGAEKGDLLEIVVRKK